MPDILRGNFKTEKTVNTDSEEKKSLEDTFETAALKRLGGSIAFVSKRKVMWDTKEEPKKKPK